jgi:hypothetical protein
MVNLKNILKENHVEEQVLIQISKIQNTLIDLRRNSKLERKVESPISMKMIMTERFQPTQSMKTWIWSRKSV